MKIYIFKALVSGLFFLGIFIFYPEIRSIYFFLIDDSENANPETIEFKYPLPLSFQIFKIGSLILGLLIFFLLFSGKRLGWFLGIGASVISLVLLITIETKMFSKPVLLDINTNLPKITYFLSMILILLIKKFREK